MNILLISQQEIMTDSTSIINEKTLSLIDLISSGGVGGNIIMVTLAILSLIAVYILIERFLVIQKASRENLDFLNSIKKFVKEKDIDSAKKIM